MNREGPPGKRPKVITIEEARRIANATLESAERERRESLERDSRGERVEKIIGKTKDKRVIKTLELYKHSMGEYELAGMAGLLIEILRQKELLGEIIFFDKESNYRISIRHLYAGKYTHGNNSIFETLLTFLEENDI